MASTSGLQNNPTNNLNTIDGLQILNATSIYDNGQLIDPTAYVPYNGATSDTNLGTYKISSSTAPTTGNNLTNKTYVDGAVSTGSGDTLGIVNLNFVRYTGSISDTDLGIYKISSSTAPSTSYNLTNKTYVDTQNALRVPYTGATSNVVLTSTNKFQQDYNALTSDTTTLVNRQTLDSAISGLGAGILNLNNVWGYANTNNLNGALKSVQEAIKYNPTLDAYVMVAVSPSTYTLVSGNWRIVNSSGTTSIIQFNPASVFQPFVKYVITFTNMSCGSGTYSGVVYNTSTAITISDSPIAITTTPQTLTMTFTTSSTNATINLRFTGTTNVYIQFTNFTVQQVTTEIIGNMLLDSEISSNITQSMGKTANFSGGLLVNQTSTGVTAATFTSASLPAGAPASTLSGTYTLAPNPTTGAASSMWLSAGTSFIPGAKYNFTFTGMSGTQTNQQVIYMYVNSYSGGVATNVGDIFYYWIPPTGSPGTVTGSFTATANSIVFQFQASVISKTVSFSTFTLTRSDTNITGITTIPTNTGTPAVTLGLNSSNQIISYTNPAAPIFTGGVSISYIPYATSANVFGNSLLYQSSGSQINCAASMYATNNITAGGDMSCSTISVYGYGRVDNRAMNSKVTGGGLNQFAFGSWANNSTSPFSDCIFMNNWIDGSGGDTNILMVKKSGFGIRQYQGTWGSSSTMTSYNDCCMKGTGDNSVTTFGPNASWSSYLVVGAGTDKAGASTAQVISTNGNLHLDGGNGNGIYYGYYANSRGTPNPHYFWGTDINFSSGIPFQNAGYCYPVCQQSNRLYYSQCMFRQMYANNSVGWGGGVNITYAFYKNSGWVNVKISGKLSYYVGGSTMAYPYLRIYSQNSGSYYTYSFNAFTNNGGNHVTFPFEIVLSASVLNNAGWHDVYIYNAGNCNTDSNDQLWVNVEVLPMSDF